MIFRDAINMLLGALAEPYRGEIWENCQRFKLVGSGYKALYENCPEQDGHFCIESARHLTGPLRALRDPAVRVVFVIGATQVLKSIVDDIYVPYVMEHQPRPILFLFEDRDKAREYCSSRLMDTLNNHPVISRMIAQVDRHAATNTSIKLPTMKLLVGGLNEGNVSTLSWPVVIVSEAWQHKDDGLLKKAMNRADRFPETCKILIESQAGLHGEDLERECSMAHRVDVSWECPFCGGRQTWLTPNEFGTERLDDFKPIAPDPAKSSQWVKTVGGMWVPPKPGSFSGMKFAPVEADGKRLTIQERARTAAWECHWCGTLIPDTRPIRQEIMDSYAQEYRIRLDNGTLFSPSKVAFFLPFECARDNRFEKTTADYLVAKEAFRQFDKVPLRDWYMNQRAVFYAEHLTQTVTRISTSGECVVDGVPDELGRTLALDAQQDDLLTQQRGKPTTGHFWGVVRAIDKMGNRFQLWRGYLKSWDEAIAIQDRFQVSNEHVVIDAAYFTEDIVQMAAAHYRIYNRPIKKLGRWRDGEVLHTWTLLKGDDRESWQHAKGQYFAFSPKKPEIHRVTVRGQAVAIEIPVFYWSNLRFKDRLSSLMSGGEGQPKFTSLPRQQLDESTRLIEVGELTYENQMSAEHKTRKPNGDPYWEKIKGRRHNHYWDCECMAEVDFAISKYVGAATERPEVAANVV